MKRPSTVLRVLATLGIIAMMFAALAGTAVAGQNPSGGAVAFWDGDTMPGLYGPNESDDVLFDPWLDGAQEVYYAAVCNTADLGLGGASTSISVQNIDVDDAYIFIWVGGSVEDWTEYAYLSAGASKTFSAADIGIPAGECAPVVVAGYNYIATIDDVVVLTPVYMAGVAKQAVAGANLPYTTAADTSVSGYNAVSGREVGYFDELYFPIVQTNCGPGGCWNTLLHIANVGLDDNAAVTVRFFPADDGSGSLQTGFQLQALLDVGQLWTIDLSEWVPEGWVGSAHLYTDDAVVAIADRMKAGTDMWITNTASNAASEGFFQFPFGPDNAPYVLFAPDVRTDYNGWNTGINVANTVDADTDVHIQYFGSNGNAPAAQTKRLAAQGMTYFYNPSSPSEDDCEQPASDVPGCEYVGGAVILSTNPVAAVIDGVKYFGNDANVGQAFSYSATGTVYTDLAMPLVQKGNPATGMGATSGINFMNPNASATVVTTTWLNPSGFGASNFGDSIVWVPGYATGFVYTMFHHNLPNGYYGSALVSSELPIAATSANVDYQVQGDGTVVWNLYNPCGFFRQSGFPEDGCVYSSPLEPLPVTATITKTVTCPTCDLDFDLIPAIDDPDEAEVVVGALVGYSGADENGFPVSGSGLTNADGEVVFAVPAGSYDITVLDVPAGYANTAPVDTVTVATGGAESITNEVTMAALEGEGMLTKIITADALVAAGDPGDPIRLLSEVTFCDASLVDAAGDIEDQCDDFLTDAAVVAHGGVDNYYNTATITWEFNADVDAGLYYVCSAAALTGDFDADALTPDETVGYDFTCEGPVYVLDGAETIVVNDIDELATAPLDIFVRDDETDAPIDGAEVCVYLDGDLTSTPICGTTDATGFFTVANAPAGTHVVQVSAAGYEEEASITVDYTAAGDAANGGLDDTLDATGATADQVVALDPVAVVVP